MPHDFQWETFVTGLLAVGAAFVTIRQTGEKERSRLRREANAALVTLPLVLSGITDWSISVGSTLMDLMLKADADGLIDYPQRSGLGSYDLVPVGLYHWKRELIRSRRCGCC